MEDSPASTGLVG